MNEAKPFCITKRDVWEAYKQVKANKGAAGVDGQSIEDFEKDLSILRLIEEPGEISCVFQFGGFCCAHDSSWWLPQRRRSQQADRVGARWVGGLSRDAPRQRLGAFA